MIAPATGTVPKLLLTLPEAAEALSALRADRQPIDWSRRDSRRSNRAARSARQRDGAEQWIARQQTRRSQNEPQPG